MDLRKSTSTKKKGTHFGCLGRRRGEEGGEGDIRQHFRSPSSSFLDICHVLCLKEGEKFCRSRVAFSLTSPPTSIESQAESFHTLQSKQVHWLAAICSLSIRKAGVPCFASKRPIPPIPTGPSPPAVGATLERCTPRGPSVPREEGLTVYRRDQHSSLSGLRSLNSLYCRAHYHICPKESVASKTSMS